MLNKIIELSREKIAPLIEGMGYEVVDIEYKTMRDGRFHLVFYIDTPDGVSLDDCERVHRAVDAPLDELDPTDGAPYCLDISSPGLDRPFKTRRDYERNAGREIEIKLYARASEADFAAENAGGAARKKRDNLTGSLLGFDGGTIRVRTEGGVILAIPAEKAARVTQYVRF